MRDALFEWVAGRYPTHRIGCNRILAALWRVLFYAIGPSRPIVFRTAHYRLIANPQRGTMTRTVIRRGYWEANQTEAFLSMLRPGALAVDVGANFGHYALASANAVGADGLVVAFEPEPGAFRQLEANVALLDNANLRAVRAGLGDRREIMPFHVDHGNPGGHSLVAGNVMERGAVLTVLVDTLDGFLEEAGFERPVDAIKIDVQGYEAKVLAGAERTLQIGRPAVLCEITPRALALAGDDHRSILARFKDLDYLASVIDEAGERAMTYQELAELLEAGEAEYRDVLFRPGKAV